MGSQAHVGEGIYGTSTLPGPGPSLPGHVDQVQIALHLALYPLKGHGPFSNPQDSPLEKKSMRIHLHINSGKSQTLPLPLSPSKDPRLRIPVWRVSQEYPSDHQVEKMEL